MPRYSDEVPALVYPDEADIRYHVAREVIPKQPELMDKIDYCLDWKPRWNNKHQCENASHAGDMKHNWCFRCPAGYIFMDMTEREFAEGRIGVSLTGY